MLPLLPPPPWAPAPQPHGSLCSPLSPMGVGEDALPSLVVTLLLPPLPPEIKPWVTPN